MNEKRCCKCKNINNSKMFCNFKKMHYVDISILESEKCKGFNGNIGFLTEYLIDFEAYKKNAIKTECNYDDFGYTEKVLHNKRIMHSIIGISTESGELLGALKKNLFYGKELDIVNIKEEIGDLFWYVAVLCDELDISLQKVLDKNIEKLKTRYPNKFTQVSALNRDLEKERGILEVDDY